MTDFETWATPILGDNPTWRESGSGELARQAYQAGRDSMKAEAVKVCHEYMLKSPGAGEAIGLALTEQAIRSLK